MTEKENFNPIDLLHAIVSAYPGMEREKAKKSLEEYLPNVPCRTAARFRSSCPASCRSIFGNPCSRTPCP